MNKAGFLLIELMIVIALCALATGFVLINVKVLMSAAARCQLQELRSVCRYLQQRARTEGQAHVIHFDLTNQSYSWSDERQKLPEQLQFGMVAGVKGPPSHPTELISKPITFQGEMITFHPEGIIQPGTVYLIDRRTNAFYALTCGITQVSFLRIYQYDGAWKFVL